MTKNTVKFSVIVFATTVLSGCSGETDPAKAGFFDNLNNLASGTYEAQIRANNAEIADLRSSNAQIEARISGLRSEISSSRSRIARLRAQASSAEQLAQLDQLDRSYASFEDNTVGLTDRQIVGELNRLNTIMNSLAS